MKIFFGIIIFILFSISTQISFANNRNNNGCYNFDNLSSGSSILQNDADTVKTISFAKAALISLTACVNTSIDFVNSAIPGNGCSNIANYIWDFGDGTILYSTQLVSPQTKSHVYSVPGTYTVKLTTQNACGTITNSQLVCVDPPPSPIFNVDVNQGCTPLTVQATNTTNTATICSVISYSWSVTYTAGNCGTSAGYSYLNGTNSSSANPTFQFSNSGIYTIKLSVSNICGTYSSIRTVEVKMPPTVSVNLIPDYCGTATFNPSAVVNSCSTLNNLTYVWNFPGGSPSSSTSPNPGNISYNTSGTYTVSLNVSNECGVSLTDSKVFTVKANPVVTNTPLNQTICSSKSTFQVNLTADLTGTTFSWTAIATSGISGFISSGITNFLPVQTITTTNSAQGTVTYAITPSFNGCTGPVTNYVVTVNPAPTFTVQPNSSDVCKDGIPTDLSVAITPIADVPTYQWYSYKGSNPPAAISGATNSSYTPLTSVIGSTFYYCIITFSSGICAILTSNTANVTVNALPTINSQPLATQSICVGGPIGTPLSVGYAGGTGAATYQWFSNTVNSTIGGTLIPSATSSTYTPPSFATVGQYYYYVTVTLSGSSCGSSTSNTAEINVVPNPTVSNPSILTQTVCQGSTSTTISVVAAGGIGIYSYQWYQNGTNSNSGGTLITGATSNSFTPLTTIAGTSYYYCFITQTGLNCNVTSNTSQVIVNIQPSVVNQPVGSTVCVGGIPTQLSVTYKDGVGVPTYQWYSNSIDNTTGGSVIPSETLATYNPPASVAGATYYYCILTFPIGGCGFTTSNTALVTVNSIPTINTQPTLTQDLCVGGPIGTPLSVSYINGFGTATYQWYSNTVNSNIGGTLIPSATNSSYMPSSFATVGKYYYYVTITLSGSNCGSATSNAAEINVVSDPIVSSQPQAIQTVCQSSTPSTLTLTATGGIGTYNYQWYQNAVNNTTTGTPIAGETNNNLNPLTNLVGTNYYYCIITQTGLNCSVTSNTSQVIVNLQPNVVNQPVGSIVCVGGIPNPLSVTYKDGVGVPTYQWYSNSIDNTIGGSVIPTETLATYNPPASVAGTTYYYCILTFPLGGCGFVPSNTALVTVNPITSINTQPTLTQDICVGGPIGTPLSVGYAGGTGIATYQWYSNTVNSNIGGTLIPSATNSSYMPSSFATVGKYYYYVTVTLSGSNCGSATSNAAEINVVANPTVSNPSILTQTVCQGSTPTTISVVAAGGVGTYIYQWYQNVISNNSGGTLIIGATSNSYAPSTSATGTIYYYCFITQTGLNCNVTSNTSEVIVNLQPSIVNQPVSEIICAGGTPTQLSVSTLNGVGAPTYQWYNNTIDDNTTGNSIAGANAITYNPPVVIAAGTTYYYCIITFPSVGCSILISKTANITANALPTISLEPTPTQSICVGGPIGTPLSVSYINGFGTATYQWYSNTVNSNIGGTLIPSATNSFYMPSSFATVGQYYYYATVTLSGSSCGSTTSNPAEIKVVANPTVSSPSILTQTVCQGSTPTDIGVVAVGGVGTYNYQWYQNTINSNSGGALIIGATSNSYTPSTLTTGTIYYYCFITQTGLNCNVTSNTSAVIVNLQPNIVNQPFGSTVCVGGTPTTLSVTYKDGVGVPTYQWYTNTIDDNTTGTLIAAATSSTYSPSGGTAATTFYYCMVTFPTGGCSVLTSNTANVTVNPLPTISSQPFASQEICAGNSIITPLSVNYTDGVGTATYQWYSNTVKLNSGGTLISGATNSTYTLPSFPVAGNYYFYVEVFLSGNGCGSTLSNPAEVIVDANPISSPQSVPTQTICINTTPQTLSITASSGLGAYTYQWYENNVNNSTSGSILSGEISSSYVPLTSSIGTKYYYCEIKNLTGVNCSVFSNTAEVIINPEPTFTSQPIPNVVCVGANPTALLVTYKDGAGTPTYQWFSNTINDNTTGTPIVIANNSTYIPATTIAGTLYYYCMITLAPGGCSILVSNAAQVIVNPNPVISLFNREICNGTAFTVIPDITNGDIVPAGTTYTWSMPVINPANSVSGASAQSTAQGLISQTLTNTTTSSATVTYTVTPLSGVCPGNDFNIIVIVNPTIIPIVIVKNISCFGIVDGSLSVSISGGIPPYIVGWKGPNGFSSNALLLTKLYAGDYILTVTDSKNCQVTNTYTITEPADIKITTDIHQNNTFFGANNGIIRITITGGTPPYNYTWNKDGIAFASTKDLNNIAPGFYEVTVSDSHSCNPKYAFYDVTVPPELIVSLINKTNLNCYGDNYGAITIDVVGGTPIQLIPGVFGYKYSWSGPNGFTSTNKDLNNLVAGTYVLNVTDNSGFSKQLTVVITQPTAIDIKITTIPKLDCTTKIVSEISSASISGGKPPYKLLWSRGIVSGLNNEIMESSQAGLVKLLVTDSMGCLIDTTYILTISTIGINSKVLDCDKHTYQFDALVLDPLLTYTYLWNFGDGVTDSTKTVIHSFATTGNKSIKLTINSLTCSIDFNQLINVEAPPILMLDKEPKVCTGDSTIIHVSGANTYRWNDNSVADSIMINRTGEYSVTGTSKAGCTALLTFMVSNFDLSKYTIQSDKSEISVTNSTVRFWSESIPLSQYYWDFGDGKSAEGNYLDHIYNITNEKTYDIKLKVINPNGCVEYVSKRIYIINSSMYNTFTPNGDGIDDIFMKSWHIKVYNRNGILIYDGSDGWDGTYKGKPVLNDTYFYVVYYSSESGTKTNSGYVTVVR